MNEQEFKTHMKGLLDIKTEKLVAHLRAESCKRFGEYLRVRAANTKLADGIFTASELAVFDRHLAEVKQQWAKQHGVVPVAKEKAV